jgi:hypothetical protein
MCKPKLSPPAPHGLVASQPSVGKPPVWHRPPGLLSALPPNHKEISIHSPLPHRPDCASASYLTPNPLHCRKATCPARPHSHLTAWRTRLSSGLRLGSLVEERMPVPQLLASVFLGVEMGAEREVSTPSGGWGWRPTLLLRNLGRASPVKEGGQEPPQQNLVPRARADVAVHELSSSDVHVGACDGSRRVAQGAPNCRNPTQSGPQHLLDPLCLALGPSNCSQRPQEQSGEGPQDSPCPFLRAQERTERRAADHLCVLGAPTTPRCRRGGGGSERSSGSRVPAPRGSGRRAWICQAGSLALRHITPCSAGEQQHTCHQLQLL